MKSTFSGKDVLLCRAVSDLSGTVYGGGGRETNQMAFQGPFPGGLGICRLSITSHLANWELEGIELPFRNKRREQNGSLQSEPFLGGSNPAKGNFGSLFGLGKMRLETVINQGKASATVVGSPVLQG